MGVLRLSLALFLFSSPAQAQWWSFLWASPTSGPSGAPSSAPTFTSASNISLGLSDNLWATEQVSLGDDVTEGALRSGSQAEESILFSTPGPAVIYSGVSTVKPEVWLPEDKASGSGKSRSQYKQLKHWKNGE